MLHFNKKNNKCEVLTQEEETEEELESVIDQRTLYHTVSNDQKQIGASMKNKKKKILTPNKLQVLHSFNLSYISHNAFHPSTYTHQMKQCLGHRGSRMFVRGDDDVRQ